MTKLNSKIFFAFLVTTYYLLLTSFLFAQHENVPVDHDVYIFLKEMKVKGILFQVHDDNPSMSRAEVQKHLAAIAGRQTDLSATEKKLLQKFQDEFNTNFADSTNTYQLIDNENYSNDFTDLFSNKIKHFYSYRDENANLYVEILGRAMYGQSFKPAVNNSELYDIGFRARGTLLNKLGYNLTVQKGGVSGSTDLAPTFDPRLNYNFKFYENMENIANYDFTEGYLRFYTEPVEGMSFSVQLGREKIKLGYGYGDRLVLSGNHPLLDFLKFDFNYGIVSFTSLQASTVGDFNIDREENYTKMYAYNKVKFSFKNFFDLGLGESIIYSGRGIDLAYLTPVAFYKFIEMSLQDRDNGLLFLDFQSRFLRNIELQATFFLDENILSHLQEMDLFSNKTAYQVGAFWYAPFSVDDLSLVLEYTKIRPYVYSHTNPKNSYTAHSQLLGHRIGPNADEIFASLSYNFNEWVRGKFEFQRVRSGENIYDAFGNVVFNAGGNPLVAYRLGIDPEHIDFLDGERINQNIFTMNFRIEPVRELFFDFAYKYIIEKNLTKEASFYSSYAFIKMTFDF